MGACMATEEAAKDKQIGKELKREQQAAQEEIRVLLLGIGESGKSTVFKQMKLHQNEGGFTRQEKEEFKSVVLGNTIIQMKTLIAVSSKLNVPLEKESNQQLALNIARIEDRNAWTPEVGRQIAELWQDSGIRQTFAQRDKVFHMDDSAAFLFDNIPRFLDPAYVPTDEDVLRARTRTVGIEEAVFKFKDMSFRMIDVGGQRAERRKWIHVFDCVTLVLFCVAMSEYDQVLREDITQNRMKESLLLFDEINNSAWFRETPFIIFFNKYDLFQEKLKIIPLDSVFKNYSGGSDLNKAQDFIKEKFLELNQSNKKIFTHYTIAIDPENMKRVIGDVRKTILSEILGGLGMLG